MGGEPAREEDSDHNMGIDNNIFFDFAVSSNNVENSEYSFLVKISTGVDYREPPVTFSLKIREDRRVSGAACEFVVCQLGKLLNLLNLYQPKE